MKKLIILITAVLLAGCEYDTQMTMQEGVVQKVAIAKEHGYKYRVEVKNINASGIGYTGYTLWTDYNYRVGDTIVIK